MGTLSQKLLEFGFFSALGTTERERFPDRHVVRKGMANTHDANNGVVVIYDEESRPWVAAYTSLMERRVKAIHAEFALKKGAYVPHSNDGGHFIREVMPYL